MWRIRVMNTLLRTYTTSLFCRPSSPYTDTAKIPLATMASATHPHSSTADYTVSAIAPNKLVIQVWQVDHEAQELSQITDHLTLLLGIATVVTTFDKLTSLGRFIVWDRKLGSALPHVKTEPALQVLEFNGQSLSSRLRNPHTEYMSFSSPPFLSDFTCTVLEWNRKQFKPFNVSVCRKMRVLYVNCDCTTT